MRDGDRQCGQGIIHRPGTQEVEVLGRFIRTKGSLALKRVKRVDRVR